MAASAPERYEHLYVRDMIDAVLRTVDPDELQAPLVQRVGSNGFVTEDILARLYDRLTRFASLSSRGAPRGSSRGAPRGAGAPVIVDLGCGDGGVGLWLAEQLEALIVGIDRESRAILRARRARHGYLLLHEASFHRASFEWTGLAPGFADAVISHDALHLAQDPRAALAEIRRILAIGGLLTFDVYVPDEDVNAMEWVRMLVRAGFDVVEIDDQTETWRHVMRRRHRARLHYESYFIKKLGADVARAELAVSRSMLGYDGPSYLASARRIELVARTR